MSHITAKYQQQKHQRPAKAIQSTQQKVQRVQPDVAVLDFAGTVI
jgi:hypothetical protein